MDVRAALTDGQLWVGSGRSWAAAFGREQPFAKGFYDANEDIGPWEPLALTLAPHVRS